MYNKNYNDNETTSNKSFIEDLNNDNNVQFILAEL